MEGLELGREGNNLRFPTWLKMMLTQDYSVSSSVQQSSHFHILSMCRKGESFLGCDLEEKWPKKVAHLFPFLCANPVSHFYEKKNKTAFLQRAAVWSCESGVPYHIGSVITVRKESSPFRIVLPLGEKKKPIRSIGNEMNIPRQMVGVFSNAFYEGFLPSPIITCPQDSECEQLIDPQWVLRAQADVVCPPFLLLAVCVSECYPSVHAFHGFMWPAGWNSAMKPGDEHCVCVCWWGRAVPEAVLGL